MYYVHVVKKVYMYGMQPSLNTKSCIKRPFCSTLNHEMHVCWRIEKLVQLKSVYYKVSGM